jgi:hypothetical protein
MKERLPAYYWGKWVGENGSGKMGRKMGQPELRDFLESLGLVATL